MKKILVTEDLHADGLALLDSRTDLTVVHAHGDSDAVIAAVSDCHAIVVRIMQLDAELLASAENLAVVSRHGVGCDNIDVAHLSSRNIPMAIAVDSNTWSVVEHVLMMMLALSKRALQYDHLTRTGEFRQRCLHHTSELAGKRVLVVGFGRIGKRIAPVLKAFGMIVTVADIVLDRQYAEQIGVNAVEDFHSELPYSDYLTVHVPLDESTRHLIGKAELAALPEHAIVINCARGGIIDEQALADAINADTIAATASDVFDSEPPDADNPLLGLKNSLLTPHNAASTEEGLSRMATYSVQNALDALDGKLRDEVIFNAAELSSRKG